ncbi:hypothetical protein SAMN04488109_5931 [Chryseolinea serpens]|uniref:Outer membrane protein beta-barrel domain-containing protein n=1 Tax=Chryseolinea serpens TaxID=947013 RepID=A0A1M5WR62_9BACT|nr:hypothetical protein [Chryseolinea serpens]SHH89989.1 hypothetical protein SAMN04488109_5931 [Chryseolinea serpens]
MKKLFLWILLGIPFLVNAQFKKGNVYVGGIFSYQNTGGNVYLTPFAGYFVNPRLALGTYVQMGYSRREDDGQFSDGFHHYISSDRDFSTAITLERYYAISEKFFFVLHTEGVYSREYLEQEIPDLDATYYTNHYSIRINVMPVFMYFPSRHWSIQGGLGYLGYAFTKSLSDGSDSHSVKLEFGKLSLGFAYYFRKDPSSKK